tara:strand:+ start:1996 stop:2934 length:939 start_codon:yes stop_codon:yes gene_type:complete
MLSALGTDSTMLARMQSFGKHVKCVTSKPDSYPERAVVPPDVTDEDALPWNTTGCKPREEYAPPYFDHPVVLSNNERLVSKTKGNNGWADPACPRSVDWSARVSHYGTILIDAATGYPMNPVGLTGMMGRGLLGKWGPNHAGDAIVTRCVEGKVQVVAIKRRDNGQWALPGGMKDHGESLAATVIREFSEEAARPREGDKADLSSERHASSMYVLDEMKASGGSVIFKGYVDDPRNTDNAWMETQAVHFDLRPDQWDRLHLGAGDDAAAVVWMDTDDSDPRYKNFYASHKHWVDYVKRHYPKDGDKKRTRSS